MSRRESVARAPWTAWILLPGALLAGGLLWRMYCTIERVQWNAPRFAPSFALAGGLNFYGTREAGPYLGWIYGPVFPIYLLPASLVSDLDGAYAVAWLLNLAAFLVPAWLVARLVLRDSAPTALAVLIWTLLSLGSEVTHTQFYYLHVDTLCVGLTLLAAWAVARGGSTGFGGPWLHVAAATAALAVWTKQSAIAVPAILCLWLFHSGERKAALRLAVWFSTYALVLAIAFAVWFGPRQLWFNLVVFHLHNPFRPSGNAEFFLQLVAAAPVWLLAAVGLLAARHFSGEMAPVGGPGAAMTSLLGWLALGSLPLGLLAATKVAGGWNSLHSLNFALLLLALALVRTAFAPALPRPSRLALGLACLAPLAGGWLAAESADLRWTPGTMQSTDLAYARKHGGRLYLPWNPLITLISDGKIYPFDDALLCLWRAGLEPPLESIRRDLPHGAIIVYPEPAQSQFALNYLGRKAPAAPGQK